MGTSIIAGVEESDSEDNLWIWNYYSNFRGWLLKVCG
jgi:hypothetical protein